MHVQRLLRGAPSLVLALLLFSGCGGGGSNGGSGGGGNTGGGGNGGGTLPGPDPTALSVSGTTPGGLTVSLAQDRATVPTGGTVTYTLALNNTTANPVDIQTVVQPGDGLPLVPATLQVVNTAGAVVYPFGTTPAQPKSTVTLQPGQYVNETLTLSNLFRAQDRYRATATFTIGGATTVIGPLVLTARRI